MTSMKLNKIRDEVARYNEINSLNGSKRKHAKARRQFKRIAAYFGHSENSIDMAMPRRRVRLTPIIPEDRELITRIQRQQITITVNCTKEEAINCLTANGLA